MAARQREHDAGRGARRLIGAVVLVALAGCAQPPPYQAVNHQRVVPLSTADVWKRLHAFFQDQQIAVVREDWAAGIIDAERTAPGRGLLAYYANCGGGAGFLHPLQRETMALTVLVQPSPDGSKVTANAAFSQTLRERRAGALTVACTSKGVLEDAVLNVASGQPMEAAVVPQ